MDPKRVTGAPSRVPRLVWLRRFSPAWQVLLLAIGGLLIVSVLWDPGAPKFARLVFGSGYLLYGWKGGVPLFPTVRDSSLPESLQHADGLRIIRRRVVVMILCLVVTFVIIPVSVMSVAEPYRVSVLFLVSIPSIVAMTICSGSTCPRCWGPFFFAHPRRGWTSWKNQAHPWRRTCCNCYLSMDRRRGWV